MRVAAAAAVLIGALLATLALTGLARELPDLWDPCHEFGMGNGSLTLTPGDACQGRSATSETRGEFLARLGMVYGFVALCGTAAIVGGWRARPAWLVAAAIGLGAETILLFFGLSAAFVVTTSAGVTLLMCARALRPARPEGAASP